MNIPRKAYQEIIKWKNSQNRKPLLLRGARQVGKTTLVRSLIDEFDHFIELNLERKQERDLLSMDDVNKIINAAYLMKNVSPSEGSILFFIDEIQESPEAIKLLRYFYEDRPDIYLIAAGSLLEFALSEVASFPVGRIEYLYLYPISFEEFLMGIEHSSALEAFHTIPIPDYAHKVLLELFHEYAIVGGMPEILSNYISNKNIALLSIKYKQLWQAYQDDVEKYKKNETHRKIIRHVIKSAPMEPDRIKFEGFGQSTYKSREVGEALRALDLAKIIRLVYPTTNLKPPLTEDIKKRPRLQFLDTGMLNHMLGLQGDMIVLNDLIDLHRGRIIQHLVNQEIISIQLHENSIPHFWVRENKDSNSEVDIAYQFGSRIIPIEVKSGKQGRLRSLHQFIDRCDHKYALRFFGGDFSIEKATTPSGKPYLLMNLPYYLSSKIQDYINYFINQHPS